MDVGAKGAGGGYADHFPSYADNYAPGASPDRRRDRSVRWRRRWRLRNGVTMAHTATTKEAFPTCDPCYFEMRSHGARQRAGQLGSMMTLQNADGPYLVWW